MIKLIIEGTLIDDDNNQKTLQLPSRCDLIFYYFRLLLYPPQTPGIIYDTSGLYFILGLQLHLVARTRWYHI